MESKKKNDYVKAEIIDDDSDNNKEKEVISKASKIKKTKPKPVLKKAFHEDEPFFEVGVDEAGRGPLFGRVYTAAVVLPKDDSFDLSMVKDSKKFHSKKKIEEAADYVKSHALAWAVSYADEKTIDEINILQATQTAMHQAITEVIKKLPLGHHSSAYTSCFLLIDGNFFNPITGFNKETNKIQSMAYRTVEGGDNKFASIAAASILAKVGRDTYIDQLCAENPELAEHYGIDSNKGYGAKRHLDGIKEHGITIWHRRSFAPCKHYV